MSLKHSHPAPPTDVSGSLPLDGSVDPHAFKSEQPIEAYSTSTGANLVAATPSAYPFTPLYMSNPGVVTPGYYYPTHHDSYSPDASRHYPTYPDHQPAAPANVAETTAPPSASYRVKMEQLEGTHTVLVPVHPPPPTDATVPASAAPSNRQSLSVQLPPHHPDPSSQYQPLPVLSPADIAAAQAEQQAAQREHHEADGDEDDEDEDEEEEDDGSNSRPAKRASGGDANSTASATTSGAGPAVKLKTGHGSSCHQCKTTKDAQFLFFCTNKAEKGVRKRRCRKKYCESCLKRSYSKEVNQLIPHWS